MIINSFSVRLNLNKSVTTLQSCTNARIVMNHGHQLVLLIVFSLVTEHKSNLEDELKS